MNLVILSLIAGLCAQPAAALEGITPSEEKKLQYCETGIADLNPHIAAECLNEKWILDKLLRLDAPRGIRFTKAAYALKDLSDTLDIYKEVQSLRLALTNRLEKDSPAAGLGLGPETDKFIEWVRLYKPKKTSLAEKAVRQWDWLDKDEKAWLTSNNYYDKWNGFTLKSRNSALGEFAVGDALRLINAPVKINKANADAARERATARWTDLDPGTRDLLQNYLDQFKTALAAGKKSEKLLKNDKPGLKRYRAELEDIRNLPLAEQMTILNRFFENTPSLREAAMVMETAPPPVGSEGELSGKEREIIAGLLRTALIKEIAGTLSGDRIINSAKTAGLPAVRILPMPDRSTYGSLNPETGEIVFNEFLVLDWMRTNKYTPADLVSRPEPIIRLAGFLSPNFVHEATHKEQRDWFDSAEVAQTYTQELEVEAMSVTALYMLEKAGTDKVFAQMLSSEKKQSAYLKEETQKAVNFKADPRGFRRTVRSEYYPDIESFEATAAACLSAADTISAELQRRRTLPASVQKLLEDTGAGADYEKPLLKMLGRLKTSVLENELRSELKWLKEFSKRNEEQILWADKALAKITAERKPAAGKIPPVR